MGCDIHLFVEYKRQDFESANWWSFGEQFRLDRDYRMFAKMANVRNYWVDQITPISKPRGLPEDIGWRAKDENRLYIVDREEAGEHEATRVNAERWVKNGYSQYDGDSWVTHPDWHSHSWLTSDEFEECVNSLENVSVEYKAVLSVLRCFESDGQITRVVFWFDN